MIEVEQKFIEQYFDTDDFNLTKNDIWLRKRGESFELMIPIAGSEKKLINQHQKIEGEEKIREIFAIPRIKSFVEDIADLGYVISFEINGRSEEEFFLERKSIFEYLKRKKPDHYQALVIAGVVFEKI